MQVVCQLCKNTAQETGLICMLGLQLVRMQAIKKHHVSLCKFHMPVVQLLTQSLSTCEAIVFL